MTWSAAYVLAGLALTLWLGRLRIRRRPSGERASRPRELANAELVYMEELFRILEPVRLVAKVDRVYRLPGSLVLVELKTRSSGKPFLTDVIQLSAPKLASEVKIGRRVAPHAFVTIERPDGRGRSSRRLHRVDLLDAVKIVALAHRREAILAGRLQPAYTASAQACIGCPHRPDCDRFHRARG